MTSAEEALDETGTQPRATRRQWAGLALLLLPMLVLATDLTVLFFALPTLSEALQPSATQALWITHVYGFLVAGFLVTMGRLADRVGPRRLLLLGSSAFAVTSTIAAFATSPEMLIGARALMGVAGATLMPPLFSLLRVMFHADEQRRLAIAIVFSAFTAGGAIGPLLGGALLESFWWGSVFLINVPLLLVLLIGGRLLLPEAAPAGPRRTTLDPLSVVLSVLGVLAIVYGLQELAATGAGRAEVWIVGAAGAAALTAFVRRQRRLREPLLDLALLADRRIATAIAALLLVGIGVVGTFYLFTQHLQWVAGQSPLHAGLWTLPYIAVNVLGALLAPRLARRAGAPKVITFGLVVAGVGGAVLAAVANPGASSAALAAAAAVIGLGQGLALALVSDLIISTAPPEQAGSAAAVQEVGGELGAAAGIALGGTVAIVTYRASVGSGLPPGMPEAMARSIEAGPQQGMLVAEQLASEGAAVLAVVQGAIADGLRVYSGVGALLALIGATLVLVRLRAPTEPGSG